MEYREPSTLRINREQKKKAKERLQSLGITLEGFVAKAWEFAINAKSDNVYEFMSKHTKKLLILFLGGAILGYLLSDYGKKTIQQAIIKIEMLDEVMK